MGGHSFYGNHPFDTRISYSLIIQDSFYKTLSEENSRLAFQNEYDFDSPEAIDFDVLIERLRDLKAG